MQDFLRSAAPQTIFGRLRTSGCRLAWRATGAPASSTSPTCQRGWRLAPILAHGATGATSE
eukprot:7809123-Pyramimonas_sp.AAC.1